MINTNKSKIAKIEDIPLIEKLRLPTGDLQSIYLLPAISKYGSMNAVAEKTGYSVPAIKKKIENLESLLGQPLLTTSHAGSVLTDFGKEVVEALEPRMEELNNTLESIIKSKGKNVITEEDPQITIPTPFPCASEAYESYAELKSDNILEFNFTPDGVQGTRVDYISLVYRFDSAVSLLNKSRIYVDVSFLSGDFNQINLELHGEDSNNNMNNYFTLAKLMKKSPEQSQYIDSFSLKEPELLKSNVLERLREICFAVPLYVILKAEQKSGSFKVNSLIIE